MNLVLIFFYLILTTTYNDFQRKRNEQNLPMYTGIFSTYDIGATAYQTLIEIN